MVPPGVSSPPQQHPCQRVPWAHEVGVRLSHKIADQVFRDLTTELERQGVSRKVSADMFGMGLRPAANPR